MKIKKVKTTIVEFSEDERKALSKAQKIFLSFMRETDKFNELPMNEEDIKLLNEIWNHSEDIQDKMYCREK